MQIKNTGIIIQARTGSTRLPKKMVLPFDNGQGIFEIILQRLVNRYIHKYPIVLATTSTPQDDILAKIAHKYKLKVVRGSENDVMSRFDEAMKQFDLQNAIRVCADNPLLDVQHIEELIEVGTTGNFDYVSYAFPDGRPVIKSHLGLFTEFVSKAALKLVRKKTDNPIYFEHVTNFIYEHPDYFRIKFLPLPKYLQGRRDLRFTLDTQEDFVLMQKIFKEKRLHHKEMPELIHWLDRQPDLLQAMQTQIIKNSK